MMWCKYTKSGFSDLVQACWIWTWQQVPDPISHHAKCGLTGTSGLGGPLILFTLDGLLYAWTSTHYISSRGVRLILDWKWSDTEDQWWSNSGGHLAPHFGPPAHFWMPILVRMTLEDLAKLFYFMTFISKFHILASRGQTSEILTIFGHISATKNE